MVAKKDYEIKIELEQQLRWAISKYSNYNNRCEAAKKAFQDLQLRHQMIEEESKTEILTLEREKAYFYDAMMAKKEALKGFKKTRTPKAKKKEAEIEEIAEDIRHHQKETVKAVKEAINGEYKKIVENGKVQCPECKDYFAKGGAFAAHYKSHFKEEIEESDGL